MAPHSISTQTSEISTYVLSFLTLSINSKSFCLFDQFLQPHFLPLLSHDLYPGHTTKLVTVLQDILACFMPSSFPLASLHRQHTSDPTACTWGNLVHFWRLSSRIHLWSWADTLFSVPQMNECLSQHQYHFLHAFICPGFSLYLEDRDHVWLIFIFSATGPRLALFAETCNVWRWFLKSQLATSLYALRNQSRVFST